MQQAPSARSAICGQDGLLPNATHIKGGRATHLVGTPIIAAGLPLVFAKPKVGAVMFVGGWAIQIVGHRLFEKNLPSTHKGWITYQLTGVIHVCEQYGEMLARRSQRKAAAR